MEKLKPCPYCGCLPKLKVRRYDKYPNTRRKDFFYQYYCDNKRCSEKPICSFSSVKEDSIALWNEDIRCFGLI